MDKLIKIIQDICYLICESIMQFAKEVGLFALGVFIFWYVWQLNVYMGVLSTLILIINFINNYIKLKERKE